MSQHGIEGIAACRYLKDLFTQKTKTTYRKWSVKTLRASEKHATFTTLRRKFNGVDLLNT